MIVIKFTLQILLVWGLIFAPIGEALASAPQVVANPKVSTTGWWQWTENVLSETAASTKEYFSELTTTQVRGFAVVLAVVGLTTQAVHLINTRLPPSLHSLSTFVMMVGSVTTYAFVAPLTERQQSQMRAEAFRQFSGQDLALSDADRKALNDLWSRIQLELSINEQMARNVKVQALMSIRPHLIEGLHHINGGNEDDALLQLAYCAVFVRKLFPELLPSDPDLVFAVRSLFNRHMQNSRLWKTKVLLMINDLAPTITPSDRDFYVELLNYWLGK